MKMSISLSHFVRGFWSHMSRSPLESTRDSRGQLCFASERGGSPCPVIPVYKYLRVCVSVCLVITSTSSSSSDNMTFTLSFSTHCAHERDCGAGGGGGKRSRKSCSQFICAKCRPRPTHWSPRCRRRSNVCVCVCVGPEGVRRLPTQKGHLNSSRQHHSAVPKQRPGGGDGVSLVVYRRHREHVHSLDADVKNAQPHILTPTPLPPLPPPPMTNNPTKHRSQKECVCVCVGCEDNDHNDMERARGSIYRNPVRWNSPLPPSNPTSEEQQGGGSCPR